MEARVYFHTEASFTASVEIPDDTPEDKRVEVAREAAWEVLDEQDPGGLCHYCSNKYELGELEMDDTDLGVYFP